jgi:polyribonucleotide nucleotidyltransferase
VPVEAIGSLIGPGGKNIKKIIDDAGGKELVDINIDDDGTVSISSIDPVAAEKARSVIEGMTKTVTVGEILPGKVTDIIKDRNSGKEIGAIVEFAPGKDGMVHVSELSKDRVPDVSSVVKVGQAVTVKVTAIDAERGRISLSIKQADPTYVPGPSFDRGDRR